jgi:hypothetical protein
VLAQHVVTPDGSEVEGPAIDRPRDRELVPPRDFTGGAYGTEKIEAGGREIECTVMTAKDSTGAVWKWYVSPEVPVNGYVRVERDGVVLVTAIEWGVRSPSGS